MQLIYTTEKYIDEFTFDVYIYIFRHNAMVHLIGYSIV